MTTWGDLAVPGTGPFASDFKVASTVAARAEYLLNLAFIYASLAGTSNRQNPSIFGINRHRQIVVGRWIFPSDVGHKGVIKGQKLGHSRPFPGQPPFSGNGWTLWGGDGPAPHHKFPLFPIPIH
jgi:hypothetical protein